MFLINSWRRIQQDSVLQHLMLLWASNSLPGIFQTCCLFYMILNTKVKGKKPKICLNTHANLLEGWPVCYSYLITLELLWLQLCAGACVQGHTLKSCDFSSTFSIPLVVLWLWGGGPRGLGEGAGGWRCSRSCPRSLQAAPECPAPCVSIGGGEGTSCTYLVSAS